MGRELNSKNGNDEHTEAVEKLINPDNWKDQW